MNNTFQYQVSKIEQNPYMGEVYYNEKNEIFLFGKQFSNLPKISIGTVLEIKYGDNNNMISIKIIKEK